MRASEVQSKKPNLRVLMLSNIYKPISTGSTNQIAGLAKELVGQGSEVHVFTSKLDSTLSTNELNEGIVIERVRCLKLPRIKLAMNFAWLNVITTPSNYRKLKHYVTKNQIDVIHVHNHMFDSIFLGILVSRKTGIPICLTLHTIMQHNQKFYNAVLSLVDRVLLGPIVSKFIDLVIAPDFNMVKYGVEKLGAERIKMIPYGVDSPVHFQEEELQDFIFEKSLQSRKIIVSVGHVNHLRNRIALVKAMHQVSKVDPSVLLVVIGDIADRRAIDFVRENNLSTHVVFTGVGTKEEISKWRSIAILEAQWLDQSPDGDNSLGVAGMEGMLAGKAVLSVANLQTFGPNTLINLQNVIVIKPYQTENLGIMILELLSDPDKLKSIGKKAQEIALANFDWKKNVNKHLDSYFSIKRASIEGNA
jgi:glycosyltransferase involved in cell wall biosynthesis